MISIWEKVTKSDRCLEKKTIRADEDTVCVRERYQKMMCCLKGKQDSKVLLEK